jgi:hypothetical protein
LNHPFPARLLLSGFPSSFFTVARAGIRSPQPEARSRNRCNQLFIIWLWLDAVKALEFLSFVDFFGSFFVGGRGGKTQREVSTSSGAARTDGRPQAMANLHSIICQKPPNLHDKVSGKVRV